MDDFTHINAQGRARMVDVSDKDITARTAKAYGVVYMNAQTIETVSYTHLDVYKRQEVLRVGIDFRIKCCGCGHMVMLPRTKFEKNVKKTIKQASETE